MGFTIAGRKPDSLLRDAAATFRLIHSSRRHVIIPRAHATTVITEAKHQSRLYKAKGSRPDPVGFTGLRIPNLKYENVRVRWRFTLGAPKITTKSAVCRRYPFLEFHLLWRILKILPNNTERNSVITSFLVIVCFILFNYKLDIC